MTPAKRRTLSPENRRTCEKACIPASGTPRPIFRQRTYRDSPDIPNVVLFFRRRLRCAIRFPANSHFRSCLCLSYCVSENICNPNLHTFFIMVWFVPHLSFRNSNSKPPRNRGAAKTDCMHPPPPPRWYTGDWRSRQHICMLRTTWT